MPSKGTPANLMPPWKPGQSGNPGGRPKRRPISDRYEVLADTVLPDDLRRKLSLKEGATYGDALALRIFHAAIKGAPPAAREVREAIEGKADQRIQITGAGGKPLISGGKNRPMVSLTQDNLDALLKLAAEKLAKEEEAHPSEPPAG